MFMNNRRKKLFTYLASLCAFNSALPNLPNNIAFAAEQDANKLKCDEVYRIFIEWLKWMKNKNSTKYNNFVLYSDSADFGNDINTLAEDNYGKFLLTHVEPFLNSHYVTNENDKKYEQDFKGILKDLNDIGIECGGENIFGMAVGGRICYIGDILESYAKEGKSSNKLPGIRKYMKDKLNPTTPLQYMKTGGLAVGGTAAAIIAAQGLGALIRSVNDTMVQQREMSRKAKFQWRIDFWAKKYAKSICRDPNKINTSALIDRLIEIKKSYPYAKKEVELFMNAYVGAILDKQLDPRAKCSPIVLIGAPGCGKSRLIKEVVNATRLSYEGIGWESDDAKPAKKSIFEKLFGKKKIETSSDPLKTGWEKDCVYICQDKIDKKSSVSPKDQLFGKHEEQRQDVKVTVYSEDYIANNFGGENIYLKFVDEFDKLDPAVLENCWDSADGGGKAIIIAAANGLPTDYVDIKGASGKSAFLSRTISIFLPSPDAAYYGKYIRKGVNNLNKECENVRIKLDEATLETLKYQCVKENAGMRSVIKMLGVIKGLQGMCDKFGIGTATIVPGEHPHNVTCKELNDYLSKKGQKTEDEDLESADIGYKPGNFAQDDSNNDK